ncbi:MAG TPA: hypothetical protein VM370_07670 [Candidatus Thermoplasmatota archaeon]|nr:hypothetical protein [Candidatus Thermoplasmatota archaeon]
MAGPNYEPIPPKLQHDMRVLAHDLHTLRENVAAGRVAPHDFPVLERILAARLDGLEAAVHARLLLERQRGGSGVKGN